MNNKEINTWTKVERSVKSQLDHYIKTGTPLSKACKNYFTKVNSIFMSSPDLHHLIFIHR